MDKTQKSNRSHLTYDDRLTIQEGISKHKSFRLIAKYLKKSTSSISKEVKRNSQFIRSKGNDCLLRNSCRKRNVCQNGCTRNCQACVQCKSLCKNYIHEQCDFQRKHSVCNKCKYRNTQCSYNKYIYDAKYAQEQADKRLRETRDGFDLTGEEIQLIDELVSPLIQQGLSLYHITQILGPKLPVSESTLRRLIDKCEITARNIDLRAKTKYKPRKHHKSNSYNVMNQEKTGHKYIDFIDYQENHEFSLVEMDCVEGIKSDEKVLLTLHLKKFHLQLAFLLEHHTSECVIETLDKIETTLGPQLFNTIFEVILTDNGHEFSNISGIEDSCLINNHKRCKVFYCEPRHSNEKGSCENNHRLIRFIIPKKTSLDSYNQGQISLMMNHINSYCRKSLYGKTPYEVASAVLPEEFFILLGLEAVPCDKVILNPKLLSKYK